MSGSRRPPYSGSPCASRAGDDGSADEETDGRAHIDFPASSPHALAVGGTMLSGATDVVWWESPGERTGSGGGATGGGVSVVFPRPSWQDVQITSINAGSIDGRVIPDIAALAGPPLYDLIFAGQDQPNGGTSASTPLWAALIALMAGAAQQLLEGAVPGAAALRGRPGRPDRGGSRLHRRHQRRQHLIDARQGLQRRSRLRRRQRLGRAEWHRPLQALTG